MKRNNMRKLDLHRMRYEDAKRTVEQFANGHWKWGPEEEGEIITGHSSNMRNMVIGVLRDYAIDYDIGGPLKIDDTFIRIY
jgi:DNA-nicking Smr family endonuclease